MGPSLVNAQGLSDMMVVEANVSAYILPSSINTKPVQTYQDTLLSDGTWSDIDYADKSRTNWSPQYHLTRMRQMALGYVTPDSALEGSPDLLADILIALDRWIALDPSSDNWWHERIKVPQLLGEILFLIKPHLSAAQLTDGVAIVARAYKPRSDNSGSNVGANRTDRAYASILRGLILDDEPILNEAFLAIADTITLTTDEGIQPDYSYHAHGPQLYIQGYGIVYYSSVLRYATWSEGTSFAYPLSQRKLLIDALLEGVQWFIRGDNVDLCAAGRSLTRNTGQATNARSYLGVIQNGLSVGEGYRQDELQDFAERLDDALTNGAADPELAWVGHRHFPRSDSTTYHRPQFSVMLKTSSTRTDQPEVVNNEGLKNLHLSDGVTLLHRTGNEYDNIMPLWDWRKLPGTTIEQADYSLRPVSDGGVLGTSTYAGGVSDGSEGASAFAYERLGVSARKSWFFLGERMIALGVEINAPAATQPVVTTVNQCLLDGAVTYSTALDTSSVLAASREDHTALCWVHHGGFGYYFPRGSGSATLVAESRIGNWNSINSNQSTAEVRGDIFALELAHGQAVSDASYAYIVAPVDSAASMEINQPDEVVIVRNDRVAQAVSDTSTGSSAVNFWAAGSAAGISADQPCLVLVTRSADIATISVSDPSQALSAELNLVIDLPASAALSADNGITVLKESSVIHLSVDLSQSDGRSLQASFALSPYAYKRVILPCVRDGYTWDANPEASYGTASSAVVKKAKTGYNRNAHFNFDLSSLSAPPEVAFLKLRTLTAHGTPSVHSVYASEGPAWSESTLTWNGQPSGVGPALASWLPAANSWVSADVSSALSESTLDLVVIADAVGSSDWVTYATREVAIPALQPILEVLVRCSSYESWKLEWFSENEDNDQIGGDYADPDNDGLTNQIEYVLGTAPTSPTDEQHHPQLSLEPDKVNFAYRRSQVSADETVMVEFSPDLETWTPLVDGVDNTSVSVTPLPEESGIEQFEVSIPRPTTSHRCFLRLNVAQ